MIDSNTQQDGESGLNEGIPQYGILNIQEEADRPFEGSSIAVSTPEAVIIMGPVASGKTTFREKRYPTGYVLVDACPIFLAMSQGEFLPFPGDLEAPLEVIGSMVAERAIRERRNIVTEVVGDQFDPTKEMIDALRRAGYKVQMEAVDAPLEVCRERNQSRGDDNISAYYAQEFNLRWITNACNEEGGK